MRSQKLIFLFSFFIFVSIFCCPSHIYAISPTIVIDDITVDTTWSLENSPYVVSTFIVVEEGATLTIEPGVIVKFDQDSELVLFGNLNALGTSAEPIYLTSYADDSVGGDTNGDGTNTTPIAGSWGGIMFFNTTDPSSFSNTYINYSSSGLMFFGAHVTLNNFSIVGTVGDAIALYEGSVLTGDTVSIKNVSNGDALMIWDGSSVTIKNLNIDGVSGDYAFAVQLYDNSILSISDSSIKNIQNDYGPAVGIYGGSLNAVNTIFENGTGDGISVYGGSTLTLDQSTVSLFADTGISDYSDDYSGADKLDIKNSKIEHNGTGISFFGSNTTYSISGNTIDNNINFGVEDYAPIPIPLQNNYWGDPSGPKHDPDNLSGLGNEVFVIPDSQVLFAPWLTTWPSEISLRNPVLIIPGVLGTEINKGTDKLWLDLQHNLTDIGDEFMDPLQLNTDLTPLDTSLTIGDVVRKVTATAFGVTHTIFDYSDGLVIEFKNQGYIEGTDLFLFPYDWRYGVSENNVNKLKQKIQDIKTQTSSDKVDIVAHSTGGLLVKKYVIENPLDKHIGKAVFVGVPNTGAPKAIKALIGGDNFGNYLVADSEMKKISQNLPVAYDLLPSQQYFDTKGSFVKVINQNGFANTTHNLDFDEANSFLTQDHQLNGQALVNAGNLHTTLFDNYDLRTAGVNLYAVDGCKTGTIGKFIESRYQNILGGNLTITYTLENTPGDGTVPLESITNLPINQENKYFALKAEHGKMLSQDGIRQEIVNLVSGSSLAISDSLITQDISKCKLNGKAISVFSPLNIDVTDQDGNYAGLSSDGVSIENNIPNADFEIMGEHKFIYLPDDEGQTYIIKIKGSGNGTFTIKDQDINDNQVTQTQVFSNIPVTSSLEGQVNIGDIITTLSLNNNDQPIQPSSVVNANQSQDLISPISTSIFTGSIGQPSFYRSNVSVNISAVDPMITGQENQTSGILKTVYKLDNDSLYTAYVNPIAVSSEGKHTLKFFSTDKAGNNEPEQSIEFTIDKTAPELQVTFNINAKDVIFSAQDLSDPYLSIITTKTTTTLADNAGNTTIIPFTKYKEKSTRLKFSYNKIIRNGVTTTIPNTNIVYDWQEKKGILTDLDTKITVKGVEKYVFNYKKANNATIIREKTNLGTIIKTKPGFVVVAVKTEGDGLKVNY